MDVKESILRIFRLHQEVESFVELNENEGELLALEVLFWVHLPSRLKGDACDASEKVFFTFPKSYPLDPPDLELRQDFGRNVPHLQPWLGRKNGPVPCVSVQSLRELIFSRGLSSVIDQMATWLNNCVSHSLIDENEGWEVARRDSTRHGILCDLNQIYKTINRHEFGCYFSTKFLSLLEYDNETFFMVEKKVSPPAVDRGTSKAISVETNSKDILKGSTLLLLAWPQEEQICSEYCPDLVKNCRDLLRFSKFVGVEQHLARQINHVKKCIAGSRYMCPPIITVGLCVRRPFHLIDKETAIEVFFYLIGGVGKSLEGSYESIPAVPMAHYDLLNPELLRKLSYAPSHIPDRFPSWSLLGCGSLGSKVALHLARSGNGPRVVSDFGCLRPHNAARHGLTPQSGGSLAWTGQKASELAATLTALGKKTNAYNEDVAHALVDKKRIKSLILPNSNFVVNATASLRVREAIGAASGLKCPAIEIGVFNGGSIGYLLCEGSQRAPNCHDLNAELNWQRYELVEQGILSTDQASIDDVNIGQGCSSPTMVMPDSKISVYGAAFAQRIVKLQAEGLPNNGFLSLGLFDADTLDLTWWHKEILPPTVVKVNGWNIRISAKAIEAMNAEVECWPDVETGGVIVGQVNVHLKTIYVSAVLGAPKDSQRKASIFELGTIGLKKRLDQIIRRSNRSVYCLGTWHSHLRQSSPFALDRSTADKFAGHRPTPFLFLIHLSNGGFEGIVQE